MSKSFLDLVKRGDTQEIADWVKDDPQVAESRDAQGVSALLWAVYSGHTVVRDFLRSGLELDLAEAAAVGDAASRAPLAVTAALWAVVWLSMR